MDYGLNDMVIAEDDHKKWHAVVEEEEADGIGDRLKNDNLNFYYS